MRMKNAQVPLFRLRRRRVTLLPGMLLTGLLLVGIGLLGPLFCTERGLRIYDYVHEALLTQDSGLLINASLRLVFMNTVRSMPIYLGILLLMECILIEPEHLGFSLVRYALSFVLLLGIYGLIYRFYGIAYTIELPAIFVLLIIRLLNQFPVKLSGKIIIILLFFTSVQGLDVAPGLTAWGFGRGEISLDIKRVAEIMACERILIAISSVLFGVFGICTVLMAMLSYEQRQLLRMMEDNQRMQRQLFKSREEALTARNYREMQSLVHDLKAPLTAIAGLAGLTLMIHPNDRTAEYQRRICDSVDAMSGMISEMLYPKRRTAITCRKLEEAILASFSPNARIDRLHTENRCPNLTVHVNNTRVTRAVINLLENASRAIDAQTGQIRLCFFIENARLWIAVHDNGHGISDQNLQRIWTPGFSEGTSSGLGLGFVRQVAQEHGGTVTISSREGSFTHALFSIPITEGGQSTHGGQDTADPDH